MFILILLILVPLSLWPQYVRRERFANEQERRMFYDLDDWISYKKSRIFSSVTIGSHYIYFGTKDGGILRYQFLENYWDYPFTTSNGLPSNRILDLVYDKSTSFLWAITPGDVAIFNPASEEWIRKSEASSWTYQFPDTGDGNNSRDIPRERFRGRGELQNLPHFFANGDYSIIGDWILMDRHFQEFPITGYVRDRYDRIWFVINGFGIGQGDLYSQRADFYEIGLPDISPRTIAYQYDDIWIGGIGRTRSRDTRPGIARWPYNRSGWEYFQARWISHLPRDDVNDIAVDGDSIWFATEYG
ncbi:MAG: hypothetical protein GWN00_23435, partial [Aliifodinibius sp.]|nr:hypothetical protein [Fodinibius sp.]NIY27649.1 hypothetical protein [Fodinibius sp.]